MSQYFPTAEECSRRTIFPGVDIQAFVCDKMMVSVVDLAPHAVVEEHSHPHEQVGIIVEGKAIFYVGDEQKTMQPGDVYRIPGHVRHRVVALDAPVKVCDIFYPVREEYR